MSRGLLTGVLAVLLLAAPIAPELAVAQTPRQITWEDLLPPGEPVADPFANLATEYAVTLAQIYVAREKKKAGMISEVSPEYERTVEMAYELEREGVDVERLLREYREAEAEIERLNRQTVPALDGQFVRLAGYALPLEFDGTAISEFLLVPFIGACIHVPPPPQNQLVFVRLSEPYVAKNVFEPVWITGRMTVGATEKTLFLTDGRAPIRAGYRIGQGMIEPYRE